jgi:quinol monooxygenase YgiN
MLVIAGHIRIDPARREDAVRAAVAVQGATARRWVASPTRSPRISDPGTFRIFEEWESPDALGAHFRTPHMAKFQGAIGGLGVREMKVQRYEISSVGPLRG